MPMDMKPPTGRGRAPFNLTRFQLGVAAGLVAALFVLLAGKGFLGM
jgi:hypothetical protein